MRTCKCSHESSRHVSGRGPCTWPTCACDGFTERERTLCDEAKQLAAKIAADPSSAVNVLQELIEARDGWYREAEVLLVQRNQAQHLHEDLQDRFNKFRGHVRSALDAAGR